MHSLIFAMVLSTFPLSGTAEVDLEPVDRYLDHFDRFTQGDESQVPAMNDTWPLAKERLAQALRAKDARSPSRLVLLMLLQVGGGVPVESEMGRAWRDYAGTDFPTQEMEFKSVFFASDFYQWWKRRQSVEHDIPLLAEWLRRDFARETVIPQYERWELAPRD